MRVRVEGKATVDGPIEETVYTEGGLADHTDKVMEHLVELGVRDPYVGLDLEQHELEITFEFESSGNEPFEAIEQAIAQLRTAIHAAGGATPGWESMTVQLAPNRSGDLIAG